MLASRAMKDNRVIRILLNVALADHLAQELGSYLTLVGLILELTNASS